MSANAAALRGISSMATRQLLADLAAACQAAGGPALVVESVGGVDAAQALCSLRVVAGTVGMQAPSELVVGAPDLVGAGCGRDLELGVRVGQLAHSRQAKRTPRDSA